MSARRLGWTLWGVAALTACGAEAPAPPSAELLLVRAGDATDPLAPERLYLFDPAGGTTEDLLPDVALTSDPAVRCDGRAVVVAGRRPADVRPVLVELDLADRTRAVHDTAGLAPTEPSFLPDGGVVFVAADGGDGDSALYAVGADRLAPVRLTYAPGRAHQPVVVPDGRILFVFRSAAVDGGGQDRLLVVHADGTGVAPYTEVPAEWDEIAELSLRDGRPLITVASRATGKRARLLLDPDRPGLEGVTVAGPAEAPLRAAGLPGRLAAHAVRSLAPQPRPSLHLSLVSLAQDRAELVMLDARRTRRKELRTAAGPLTLRVQSPLARTAAGDPECVDVPLAADGSFYLDVPADLPLAFEIVDAKGRSLARQEHSIWLRPAERRVCIGCHDDRLTTAPNRSPEALAQAATVIDFPSLPFSSGSHE